MGIFDAQGIDTSKPQSQQTTTNNISSWAQPYVNQYLTQAQTLANQGPNQAQQNVYAAAGNLQTPGQFAQGTDLLNQAGQGNLGTTSAAMGYGGLGAGIGALATGAGQNYQNMATSPAAMQAYMNPYIQQSLAPQLGLLNQQEQLGSQKIAAQATGQGAFGGNRATLAQGLNNQNYDLAKQQAIGQGYNTAFQNAQQAQQFGSTLGLQGLQAGMTGAGLGLQGVTGAQAGYNGANQAGVGLGNLGAQQGQYGLNQLTLQNQIANQQYNLPFQNNQYLQSMMQGLPVSGSNSQGYQAAPNAGSQVAGWGTAAVGGYGLANKLGLFDKNPFSGTTTTPTDPYSGQPSAANQQIALDNVAASPDITNMQSDPMSPDFMGMARGGRVFSYAGGGLVSLAIKNALKG